MPNKLGVLVLLYNLMPLATTSACPPSLTPSEVQAQAFWTTDTVLIGVRANNDKSFVLFGPLADLNRSPRFCGPLPLMHVEDIEVLRDREGAPQAALISGSHPDGSILQVWTPNGGLLAHRRVSAHVADIACSPTTADESWSCLAVGSCQRKPTALHLDVHLSQNTIEISSTFSPSQIEIGYYFRVMGATQDKLWWLAGNSLEGAQWTTWTSLLVPSDSGLHEATTVHRKPAHRGIQWSLVHCPGERRPRILLETISYTAVGGSDGVKPEAERVATGTRTPAAPSPYGQHIVTIPQDKLPAGWPPVEAIRQAGSVGKRLAAFRQGEWAFVPREEHRICPTIVIERLSAEESRNLRYVYSTGVDHESKPLETAHGGYSVADPHYEIVRCLDRQCGKTTVSSAVLAGRVDGWRSPTDSERARWISVAEDPNHLPGCYLYQTKLRNGGEGIDRATIRMAANVAVDNAVETTKESVHPCPFSESDEALPAHYNSLQPVELQANSKGVLPLLVKNGHCTPQETCARNGHCELTENNSDPACQYAVNPTGLFVHVRGVSFLSTRTSEKRVTLWLDGNSDAEITAALPDEVSCARVDHVMFRLPPSDSASVGLYCDDVLIDSCRARQEGSDCSTLRSEIYLRRQEGTAGIVFRSDSRVGPLEATLRYNSVDGGHCLQERAPENRHRFCSELRLEH